MEVLEASATSLYAIGAFLAYLTSTLCMIHSVKSGFSPGSALPCGYRSHDGHSQFNSAKVA